MDYMALALSLASLALGQVSPNPVVGAVVVKNHVVVGQGYTQPPGFHHAEVVALKQASEKARGGTMYTTLEPCCHYGRTPPCSQAIIAAGITDVHMAMLDPNLLVAGRGKDELEKAGIKTFVGEHEQEARDLNEAYIKFITTGRPFVTVKYAMSLDGKIATRSGDSKWISGDNGRHYVHNLRYESDAIMVGANTILADDPHLTARCASGRGGTVRKQPLRVVVDGKGRIPHTARVIEEPGKTLLVLGQSSKSKEVAASVQAGAELLELPLLAEGQVDLEELLKLLGERGITSVLVEGGGILIGSLFDQGLVDRVVVIIAPIIIGGEKAKIAVSGRGVNKVIESFRLKRVSVKRFDPDLMISGYVVKKGEVNHTVVAKESMCLPDL
jgi:diaminohydroxyphosphoribosylaminopyrimidine deaminase/5-amino-6-(5-phosphoribosylamino)uracil reductase